MSITPEYELPPSDENDFAKIVRAAIGASDFERVSVVLPQFERTDGRTVANPPPSTFEAWDAMREIPTPWLKELGVGLWDLEDGVETLLYPKEWYDAIPDGYPIVDISGNSERFQKGATDNDYRFGCLAFGFQRKVISS